LELFSINSDVAGRFLENNARMRALKGRRLVEPQALCRRSKSYFTDAARGAEAAAFHDFADRHFA
jgi:hypothetical protein